MVRLYHQFFTEKARGVHAEALLREVLCRPELTVCHEPSGRPYLPDGPEISISHSGGHLLVALSEGPVGVDCQLIRTVYPGLPQRALGSGEYQLYLDSGKDPTVFFALWTLKESYYKYLGTGLPGMPNGTEFYRQAGVWRLRGSELFFQVLQKKDLLIALCSDEQGVMYSEQRKC